MKVRIGIGTGRGPVSPEELVEVAGAIVRARFDSLWLSEVLTGAGLDPLVGLAYATAAQPSLKIGTTMLVPGRNPVRLAKALASLDRLSGGRLLVTFVPGLTEPPERDAIGVAPSDRSQTIEEALPLLRALLSGVAVSYDGVLGSFRDVVLAPLPVQQPLEFWLGGLARASLLRCGRIADGWLPSLCSPEEARRGKAVIDAAAEEASRRIDPEHFGVSVPYVPDGVDVATLPARRPGRAGQVSMPVGYVALRALLEAYLDVGFSKFVVRPAVTPASWEDELDRLGASVGSLQS